MKYGKLNWIRLWLLGHEPTSVDTGLFTSGSLSRYREFMTAALKRMRARLRADGYVCLVIGDVRRETKTINLAKEVADSCAEQAGLRVLDVLDDHLPVKHKVSRIWGDTRGRATKTDRILVLGGPKAPRLPAYPKIDWSNSNCYGA
jgi:site-specific DNA-methyltransferase (adenine-specific)